MRKSTVYLIFTALSGMALILLMALYPVRSMEAHRESLHEQKQLVRQLEVTDLCLFTEARYTRHLSQADLHSAFQDHPVALEHFPSGSIVFPPALWISDDNLD